MVRVLRDVVLPRQFCGRPELYGAVWAPTKPGQPILDLKIAVDSRGRVCFGHRRPHYGDNILILTINNPTAPLKIPTLYRVSIVSYRASMLSYRVPILSYRVVIILYRVPIAILSRFYPILSRFYTIISRSNPILSGSYPIVSCLYHIVSRFYPIPSRFHPTIFVVLS